MRCSQLEVDDIVQRCRNAVEKYGGQSNELKQLRKYYQMLHDCTEHGAYVMLESELEKLGF